MNAVKIIQSAEFDLEHGRINLGEYEKRIAPLNDVECVIRCRDCKYAYLTSDGECKYCEMEKDDNGSLVERYRSWDWYCADGERKGDYFVKE